MSALDQIAAQAGLDRQDRQSRAQRNVVVRVDAYDLSSEPRTIRGTDLETGQTVEVYLRPDSKAGQRRYPRPDIQDYAKNPGKSRVWTMVGGSVLLKRAIMDPENSARLSGDWLERLSPTPEDGDTRVLLGLARVTPARAGDGFPVVGFIAEDKGGRYAEVMHAGLRQRVRNGDRLAYGVHVLEIADGTVTFRSKRGQKTVPAGARELVTQAVEFIYPEQATPVRTAEELASTLEAALSRPGDSLAAAYIRLTDGEKALASPWLLKARFEKGPDGTLIEKSPANTVREYLAEDEFGKAVAAALSGPSAGEYAVEVVPAESINAGRDSLDGSIIRGFGLERNSEIWSKPVDGGRSEPTGEFGFRKMVASVSVRDGGKGVFFTAAFPTDLTERARGMQDVPTPNAFHRVEAPTVVTETASSKESEASGAESVDAMSELLAEDDDDDDEPKGLSRPDGAFNPNSAAPAPRL